MDTTTVDTTRPAAGMPAELSDDRGDLHYVPASCQLACPIGTDAPSYIGLVWEGKLEQAYEAITATNPFSSVCARVCDAPCERACRRGESDAPLAIRNLKRYVMERIGEVEASPAAVTRSETVGIVGGGPAGLTAAQDLALAGFGVHVYEMGARLGGMMATGIPHFVLPAEPLAADIARILKRCPGIEIHLRTALGRDVSLAALKQRHTAVLLSIGATWGKKLPVPGGALPGVIDGVGFLAQVNAGERPVLPATVLVIGGGDVAIDVARTAVRLGAKRVEMCCIESRAHMPAHDLEVMWALKEGIVIANDRLPQAVTAGGAGGLVVQFVKTANGGLNDQGQLSFEVITGSEHEVACGMVIAAIGQGAENAELSASAMLERGRVRADFDTMRTADRQVFAAGDGAFGGSTIVSAIHHGHKAAYYIKAFLDGQENPAPYRTPYRTRRVPIAQDPNWTRNPRNPQRLRGTADPPADFAELESGYDDATAVAEAARCLRCDLETGSANYTVRTREDIFAMARTAPGDAAAHARMLARRLATRPQISDAEQASFDDLVFLPANLSRLVIDPYREACVTETVLGRRLRLSQPVVVTGFDDAPAAIRAALDRALVAAGCVYAGRRSLGAAPWLQMLKPGGRPDPMAAGVVYLAGASFAPFEACAATHPGQLRGITAPRAALPQVIPFALENHLDLLILDGSSGGGGAWPELAGEPDLAVLRDAVRVLREHNREEEIDLVYFGGVRSGNDVAKVLALGCVAAMTAVTLALAMGGVIDGDTIVFPEGRSAEERQTAAELMIESITHETSTMARCTGKTSIHNLEPEDLKSISVVTAQASGIALVGRRPQPLCASAAGRGW